MATDPSVVIETTPNSAPPAPPAPDPLAAGKALLQSKTFWLNVIGTLAQVLPGIAPMIPQPYGVVVLGLLNVLNRLITSQPITSLVVQ